MSLTAFVATSVAILLMPGPTNILLAASGAAIGFRRGVLLPIAQAIGYAVAVGAFLLATRYLSGVQFALPALKAVAATWLLVSALKLWRQPVRADMTARRSALLNVFVTTALNPKAMLVGTIVIPGLMSEKPLAALFCFVTLSSVAGLAWLSMGSMLPENTRPYAYKGAALILGIFSAIAASSLGSWTSSV